MLHCQVTLRLGYAYCRYTVFFSGRMSACLTKVPAVEYSGLMGSRWEDQTVSIFATSAYVCGHVCMRA